MGWEGASMSIPSGGGCCKSVVLSVSLALGELACSRLRDGGGKSFSNKKCEKRVVAGERQRVLFSFCSFLYFPTILSESLAQAMGESVHSSCLVCHVKFF